MQAADRWEYATADDPALNYCLWPYPAPADAADKFRSVNLLFQSFQVAGADPRAYVAVEALRDGIGPFRTVYGVKWDGRQLGWEYYFYDYARRDRAVGATQVLQALRPHVRVDVALSETLPYFMFSLDMDDALLRGERALDLLHMYVGNPGSAVSSGIAYAVGRGRTELENFYFFFDAASGLDEAARKIESSAQVDLTQHGIDEILLPELRGCRTLCVANKRTHDCIYFSGIDVGQLLWFLQREHYPQATIDHVLQHRTRLDHLLFDVGIDYVQRDGRIVVLKSGYYGVF